jgi:MFS family permease
MAAKLNRNVKALAWVSFLNDINSEAILPLLPLFITQVLGLNRAFLGLIEGVADTTASLLKIASGYYSDRTSRRKPPTVVGYVLSTAVKPLLAISTAGWHVLTIRFLDRTGKGIRTAPRDALIAESTPAQSFGRAFGFHRMMDTLGAVVGSLLAYVFLTTLGGSEEHRMRTLFLLATAFGVAACVILLIFVREAERLPKAGQAEPDPADSSTRRVRLGAFLCVNTVFYLGTFSYAFFLLRAQSLGVATAAVPLIYMFYNIVYAAVALPIGNLSDSIGRKPVILLAYASYAALCIGFAFATTTWHAWALFAVYGLHSATVNPASRALVSSLSRARSRGTALGAYHTTVGLAALPASLIAGVLWDRYGAAAPFLFGGFLALVASLALFMISFDDRAGESV